MECREQRCVEQRDSLQRGRCRPGGKLTGCLQFVVRVPRPDTSHSQRVLGMLRTVSVSPFLHM